MLFDVGELIVSKYVAESFGHEGLHQLRTKLRLHYITNFNRGLLGAHFHQVCM